MGGLILVNVPQLCPVRDFVKLSYQGAKTAQARYDQNPTGTHIGYRWC